MEDLRQSYIRSFYFNVKYFNVKMNAFFRILVYVFQSSTDGRRPS